MKKRYFSVTVSFTYGLVNIRIYEIYQIEPYFFEKSLPNLDWIRHHANQANCKYFLHIWTFILFHQGMFYNTNPVTICKNCLLTAVIYVSHQSTKATVFLLGTLVLSLTIPFALSKWGNTIHKPGLNYMTNISVDPEKQVTSWLHQKTKGSKLWTFRIMSFPENQSNSNPKQEWNVFSWIVECREFTLLGLQILHLKLIWILITNQSN